MVAGTILDKRSLKSAMVKLVGVLTTVVTLLLGLTSSTSEVLPEREMACKLNASHTRSIREAMADHNP